MSWRGWISHKFLFTGSILTFFIGKLNFIDAKLLSITKALSDNGIISKPLFLTSISDDGVSFDSLSFLKFSTDDGSNGAFPPFGLAHSIVKCGSNT